MNNSLNLAEGMVSIIIPVYNVEKYLQRCVESAIGQTYANIEILLIDDGSTDDSGNLCDEYASKDARVKVIHKKNGGPADARNVGIEYSRGEFVFFMDADDAIEGNAIELLMENQSRTRADIVAGDYRKVGDKVLPSGLNSFFKGSVLMEKTDVIAYARAYLNKPNKPSLLGYSWGRLFRAVIIKDNNIKFNVFLRTFEDVAFNFEYLKYANKFYFLNEIIYNYTIYDTYSSATMTFGSDPKRLLGYRQALVSASSFLKANNFSDRVINKEIGYTYTVLSIIQLVRMCGQFEYSNKGKIFDSVKELVESRELRMYLRFYTPTKGDSRIIPLLMRLRLVYPIIWVCRYKAYKRYRKASSVER